MWVGALTSWLAGVFPTAEWWKNIRWVWLDAYYKMKHSLKTVEIILSAVLAKLYW
jgi:hypothetical protein